MVKNKKDNYIINHPLTKQLSNIGLTKYIDDDGKIHFTTKSLEKLEKEKEEELTRKLGKVCPLCNKRNKHFDNSPDGWICRRCFKKLWKVKNSYAEISSVKTTCPFCDIEFLTQGDEGTCECGAIYNGYLDDMDYEIIFYKKLQINK